MADREPRPNKGRIQNETPLGVDITAQKIAGFENNSRKLVFLAKLYSAGMTERKPATGNPTISAMIQNIEQSEKK